MDRGTALEIGRQIINGKLPDDYIKSLDDDEALEVSDAVSTLSHGQYAFRMESEL